MALKFFHLALKKYGKCFLKMNGNPDLVTVTAVTV